MYNRQQSTCDFAVCSYKKQVVVKTNHVQIHGGANQERIGAKSDGK
jgi:hypothetical protein